MKGKKRKDPLEDITYQADLNLGDSNGTMLTIDIPLRDALRLLNDTWEVRYRVLQEQFERFKKQQKREAE